MLHEGLRRQAEEVNVGEIIKLLEDMRARAQASLDAAASQEANATRQLAEIDAALAKLRA